MEAMEIVIVMIGIGLYCITFLMPDKKSPSEVLNQKVIEEAVEKKVELEYQEFQVKVEEILDETISYASEKTERLLERLTNEKIQHMDEFSATVLNEIHKNHEETMFLYDMLVQKQKAIKTMTLSSYRMEALAEAAASAEDSESDVTLQVPEFTGETAIDRIGEETEKLQTSLTVKEESKVESIKKLFANTPVNQSEEPLTFLEEENVQEEVTTEVEHEEEMEEVVTPEKTSERGRVQSPQEAAMDSIMEEVKMSKVENYNLKILELYKEGLDETEIAKELGRGVGEVKLVIGLFKEV